MFHMTTLTDDRINDLYATAAELRHVRAGESGPGRLLELRLWVGTLLLTAGTALVSGAHPATVRRAWR